MFNLKKNIKFKNYDKSKWKVYFLFNKSELIYIGCTNNIPKRLDFHSNYYDPFNRANCKGYIAKKTFTSYRFIIAGERKKAYNLESKLIKRYRPKYNNYKDYYWRQTKKMLYSEKSIFAGYNDLRRINYRIICIWTKKRFKEQS